MDITDNCEATYILHISVICHSRSVCQARLFTGYVYVVANLAILLSTDGVANHEGCITYSP